MGREVTFVDCWLGTCCLRRAELVFFILLCTSVTHCQSLEGRSVSGYNYGHVSASCRVYTNHHGRLRAGSLATLSCVIAMDSCMVDIRIHFRAKVTDKINNCSPLFCGNKRPNNPATIFIDSRGAHVRGTCVCARTRMWRARAFVCVCVRAHSSLSLSLSLSGCPCVCRSAIQSCHNCGTVTLHKHVINKLTTHSYTPSPFPPNEKKKKARGRSTRSRLQSACIVPGPTKVQQSEASRKDNAKGDQRHDSAD